MWDFPSEEGEMSASITAKIVEYREMKTHGRVRMVVAVLFCYSGKSKEGMMLCVSDTVCL